jgi:magnesium-protoporphyrin IX monomethyl ester (oxidative) cyclase
MYLNDHQRTDFYSTIGLDTKRFDQHVIRKTNQSSKTLFPVILDVDHPQFFPLLDQCSDANQNLGKIEKESQNQVSKFLQKLPSYFTILISLIKIYSFPAIETKYFWTTKN